MATGEFLDPKAECDLVMKGGLTSGIVYPPALLALARRYRFRSIGGTSAGAIAAAGAAAAEYGRAKGGFEKLGELSTWLGKGSNLRDLFQPAPAARPLLAVLLALAPTGPDTRQAPLWARLPLALARHDAPFVALGAALGGALGAGLAALAAGLLGGALMGSGLVVLLGLAFLGAGLGGLGLGLWHLARIATRTLPGTTAFGLCVGHTPGAGSDHPRALTDWLAASINDLAGLPPDGPPLTFAQLDERRIDLRMVTSNLSHGRPYRLPLDQNVFLFREEEWAEFFPAPVIAHLKAHAYQSARIKLTGAGMRGYHFLPAGKELPVIVATRLSLSFPLLLSALPLYTIRTAAFRRAAGREIVLRPEDLHRNWFSDGGISSNFPIHFFDAWLPRRPTFGIKLTTFPSETKGWSETTGWSETDGPETPMAATSGPGEDAWGDGDPDATEGPPEATDELAAAKPRAVELPPANRALPPDWEPIEDLVAFVRAIFTTAQNHRDNAQAALPGYRDRVVQVRLEDHEGGLNLAMPTRTIAAIAEKGQLVGETLLRDFDFDHHRWVRFQVLLNQLEGQLQALAERFDNEQYAVLLATEPGKQADFPYPRNKPWCDEALRHIAALQELAATLTGRSAEWRATHREWGTEDFFAHDSPRPEPVLRVVPDL